MKYHDLTRSNSLTLKMTGLIKHSAVWCKKSSLIVIVIVVIILTRSFLQKPAWDVIVTPVDEI